MIQVTFERYETGSIWSRQPENRLVNTEQAQFENLEDYIKNGQHKFNQLLGGYNSYGICYRNHLIVTDNGVEIENKTRRVDW